MLRTTFFSAAIGISLVLAIVLTSCGSDPDAMPTNVEAATAELAGRTLEEKRATATSVAATVAALYADEFPRMTRDEQLEYLRHRSSLLDGRLDSLIDRGDDSCDSHALAALARLETLAQEIKVSANDDDLIEARHGLNTGFDLVATAETGCR